LNYAARVASSAGGNEIVVSSLVHDLVSSTGEFAFSQPREVELKGFTGKHRVYPLVAN
jgi:class 3 adenylate cyclase